jgi:hypothetical protein
VLVQHARELAAGQQTNEQALVLVEGPDHLGDAQPLKDRVAGQLAGERPGAVPNSTASRIFWEWSKSRSMGSPAAGVGLPM